MASRKTSKQAQDGPGISPIAEPAARNEFGTATNLENAAVQVGAEFGTHSLIIHSGRIYLGNRLMKRISIGVYLLRELIIH